MIITNGIDIIDIRRIKNYSKNMVINLNRDVLVLAKLLRSEKKLRSAESYAKRYAAKEACAKALGTGLARGVFWKDIEVYNDKYGKPKIKFIKMHLNFLKK